jgi:hypothetical protein
MKFLIITLTTLISFSAFSMTEADRRHDASLDNLEYEFNVAISKASPADRFNLKTKRHIIISNFDNSDFQCNSQLSAFKEIGADLIMATNKEIAKAAKAKNYEEYIKVSEDLSSLEKVSLEKFNELLACIKN